MTERPQRGLQSVDDAPVAVAHPRLLVAESLCVALRGLQINAHLGDHPDATVALVETSLVPLIERLAQRGTLVLSFGRANPAEIARAAAAGASGHLGEDQGLTDLAAHLDGALRSGRPPASIRHREPLDPLDELTPREREVLQALVSGMRAADIARADFVSVTTVRNQIQSILTKLNAHSQVEAISIAVRAGWTPLAA